MTKKEKREKRKKERGIVNFMMITHHFFHSLREWLLETEDPRHQSYITYSQADLVYMALMKNICGQYSMREMEENFNEENCIDTLRIMSGNKHLKEMPHYDTLNYYLERLSPECIANLRKKMVTKLIRSRQFHKFRLQGKYWRIILDGTGLFYFKERHCENCLCVVKTDETGKQSKQYYHKVLEAKIVLSEYIILSIETEFIENERVSKQDCEINAAKRLLKRIKKEYPRLPICIEGDALYATEPFMKLCREYNWYYLLTQKESRQKNLNEGFGWIKAGKAGDIDYRYAALGHLIESGYSRFTPNYISDIEMPFIEHTFGKGFGEKITYVYGPYFPTAR